MTYQQHIGMQSERSETSSEEDTETITMAVHMGYKFNAVVESVDMSEDVSSSFSTKLREEVMRSTKHSYDETLTVPCKADNGASLYQWVTTTGEPGERISVWGEAILCRTGEYFNKDPECPWSYCEDSECRTCKDEWWQMLKEHPERVSKNDPWDF